jgi:hypothetical protein
MELIYLWVETYKNIKREGFPFSATHLCELEQESDLSIRSFRIVEEKENDMNLFGSKIESVTGIIGENGSGKTNILDLIGMKVNQRSFEKEAKYFILYKQSKTKYVIEGKGIDVISPILQGITITPSFKDIYSLLVRYDEGSGSFKFMRFLNYTEREHHSLKILSFNKQDASRPFVGPHDILEASHLFERITLQPLSIGYYSKYKMLVEFNKDKDERKRLFSAKNRVFLKISPNLRYKTDSKEKLDLKVNYDRDYRSVIMKIGAPLDAEDILPDKRKSQWILFLHEDYLHFTWHSLVDHMKRNGSVVEEILELKKEIESVEVEKDEERPYYEKLLERLMREIGDRLEYNMNGENMFFQAYQGLISLLQNIPSEYFHEYTINIAISDEEMDVVTELLKTLDNEYLKMDEPDFLNRVLSVDFYPFSSGEEAYLDLFATLYQGVTLDTNQEKKKLLILLDEPDRYMHPEWCRLFLWEFKRFLEGLPGGYIDYQVVFTTHSPFLISDLPNSHVITLKKQTQSGKCMVIHDSLQVQTFASNIHALLADKFFLDSTMGELAIQSINKAIKQLNDNRPLKEKAKLRIISLIEQIGEPIIRTQLLEMYNAKVPQEREERRRALLEEQRKIEMELQSLDYGDDA